MFFFSLSFIGIVAIGSSTPYIFDGLFQPNSGCTVLLTVPMNTYPPYGSYFKAEVFPDMNTKLAANQDRYNRNLRQGKTHHVFRFQIRHSLDESF